MNFYRFLANMAKHNIKYALCNSRNSSRMHLPSNDHHVPEDFFGICVAATEDENGDQYQIDMLHDLGLIHVRIDYSYSSIDSYTDRFLKALIQEGFKLCLHLVQPFEEAQEMHLRTTQDRWRDFVNNVMEKFGNEIEVIEIGSTCNRRKWSGYKAPWFLTAWNIASELGKSKGIVIAGPNVTDYEPIYNIGLLGIMKENNSLPAIHTDNLFVERTTEPESFDHKILGHKLAPTIKYNLIKKAHTLANISSYFGITRTFSTHVAWSLRRIDRVLSNTEEKHADYLSRYCCLAMTSGALDRVYWGPFIGQREGVIDDGTLDYPKIPHVTFYGKANGNIDKYRKRPAFDAYKTAVSNLSGTTYQRAISTANKLEIHEFKSKNELIHVAWTTNGRLMPLVNVYDENFIRNAKIINRDGTPAPARLSSITESPIYIIINEPNNNVATKEPRGPLSSVIIYNNKETLYHQIKTAEYDGICTSSTEGESDFSTIDPAQLEAFQEKNIMRNRRNVVWSMPDPCNKDKTIVIKRLQIKAIHKRVIQLFRHSRALKSWNGTNELLRRGINTCSPVAFFQNNKKPSIAHSYFIYEAFNKTGSIREAFTEFAKGSEEYQGVSKKDLYEGLADFLNNMHQRGVYFRDLSAGNVLLNIASDKKIVFCLIDTARARFYNSPIRFKDRLNDLKRITHPLNWECRNKFLKTYLAKLDRTINWQTRIPFYRYDLKHYIKKKLKPFRRS